MITRIELAKRILEERPESSDGWIKDESLEGVKLGNFAWKRQRNVFIRMLPAFEKYRYETATKTLGEYLQRRKDRLEFTFKTDCSKTSLAATTLKKKQTWNAGLMNTIFGGNAHHSDKIKIPAIDLTITNINRRYLEHSLNAWKLDMTSSYIKEEQRKKGIPCIISEIVKAAIPRDQANKMAYAEKKQRIEGKVKGTSADDSVKTTGNIVRETSEKTEGYIHGTVLYKVLPLEVDPTGHIEAKEDSKGFVKGKVLSKL
ncbi:uncharacterized protein LOC110461077 [Mizuhopecten yessoensis]|uniref:Uncharacterized protein n=1 Tax=Mizuhopecten yessoensis TaxID=6573 RepID=A0A210Q0Y7_MIZYE|nr:uncharacterized protein LOC110461077 [Mizuhopecten yessoensis]OWF42410.1 hypothetical protein KP79_PYT24230 [Mizuhopecten yessoensis]